MAKKIRIGIDARDIEKDFLTGIGRYTQSLIKSLVRYGDEYEIVLYTDMNASLQLDRDTKEKIHAQLIKGKKGLVRDQIRLPAYLKKNSIDIYFSPYIKTAVLSSVPRIITIHDTITVKKWNSYYFRHKIYIRSAAAVATVSEYSKNMIIDKLGADEKKIFVIRQAIGEQFKKYEYNEIQEVLKRYSIPQKYILYVGNFRLHKNVNTLIDAYSGLESSMQKEYRLVLIAKKDEHYERLKQKICSNDYISVFDFVPDDDIPCLYNGASVLVIPSFEEGFGLPPLEAMACGCPVLSSDAASLPEVLRDAALYFSPGNTDGLKEKIKDVLGDNNKIGELRARGFERAKYYDQKQMYNDVSVIISKVMGL